LTPIKLNTVVVRGYNEDDVIDLARLTLDHPWQVRYIELMPLGDMAGFARERMVSDVEIRERIERAFGALEVIDRGALDGEARMYRIRGAQGQIGLISSVTYPFCSGCTRARLTADGVLRLCLLHESEVNLLQPLRQGAHLVDLKETIRESLWNKPWGHNLADNAVPGHRVMSQIGG
jgi:cyclic pyranopterin phosphate synthase